MRLDFRVQAIHRNSRAYPLPSPAICRLSSVDSPELAAMAAYLLVHNRATLYS